MTLQEGNEHARVDDQTTPAEPTTPATAPEAKTEIVDIDDAELRAAIAAVKAEETAEGDKDESTPPAAPAAEPGQTDQKPEAKAPTPMIPKPRFDEVLTERDRLVQEVAYLRGVADARAAPAPGEQPKQPQAPQVTPEQRLAAIGLQVDGLAEKFDNGEITMAEFKRQERQLAAQEQAIREDMLRSSIQPTPAGDDQLYLDAVTAQIAGQHPWVSVLEAVGSNADWDYLRTMAAENLQAKGIDPRAGKVGTMHLRQEVARLADEFGPALLTSRAKAKGIALPGSSTPPTAPPLSPTAQARAAKLEQAAGLPPNLSAMTGSTSPGEVTASRLEAMNDDEIGALPASVRNKLLGITA